MIGAKRVMPNPKYDPNKVKGMQIVVMHALHRQGETLSQEALLLRLPLPFSTHVDPVYPPHIQSASKILTMQMPTKNSNIRNDLTAHRLAAI